MLAPDWLAAIGGETFDGTGAGFRAVQWPWGRFFHAAGAVKALPPIQRIKIGGFDADAVPAFKQGLFQPGKLTKVGPGRVQKRNTAQKTLGEDAVTDFTDHDVDRSVQVLEAAETLVDDMIVRRVSVHREHSGELPFIKR